MEAFSGFTDDQTALIGCIAALAACGSLLALSSLFGRRRAAHPTETVTLRFPATSARSRSSAVAQNDSRSERRAA